jgi:hypothetical protein
MGKTEVNLDIGTNDFSKMASVSASDTDICKENCILIEEKCGFFATLIASLLKLVGFSSDLLQCPFK